MLWHTPYVWGGESLIGTDCSGSISWPLWLMGYRIRVTADFFHKELTLPLSTQLPEPGDLAFWMHPTGAPKEGSAIHVAVFSDSLLIMDADRNFIDTPLSSEILSRPDQAFEFRQLNFPLMRTISEDDNRYYVYGVEPEVENLFGCFRSPA